MEKNNEQEESTGSTNELLVDVAQAEGKSQVNLEVIDDVDTTRQRVYRIRPHLYEKFKPLNAKEVIQNVLFDRLSTKVYSSEEAREWAKDIADTIKMKIKELKFKHYKYLVNVVLGQQQGAGVKMGTRCLWDAEADAYAYDSFINDTIFCVATVYAVYYY